jgi:hypothetical protein
LRIDVDSAAAASGVHDALVLVRESWGAQVMARMWGLGISRPDAEHIYRTNDTCRLQAAVLSTEADNGGADEFKEKVARLNGDSAQLRTVADLPDTTVRFIPGLAPLPICRRRVDEDRAGFTLYPPLMLDHGGNNIYVRELHARDTLILAEHPERPIWLLTKAPSVGSPLRFERISLDSMRREWQLDSPGPP